MITLLIVDVQNDFITGTARIKNVSRILDPIKKFITKNKQNIDKILFAVDWHPYNHCSFKNFGGELPRHCIQFTPGACIEPKLLKHVHNAGIRYEVDVKGILPYVETETAFSDIDFVCDELGKRYYFDSIVEADAETDFVICGINICDSIFNLLAEDIVPQVLLDGTYDNFIRQTISENNLKIIQ